MREFPNLFCKLTTIISKFASVFANCLCHCYGLVVTTIVASELSALLGTGTEFEGTLLFDGNVRIDGTFRGKIVSDGMLIIGDGAQVDAQIDVTHVIIRGGSVRGAIRSRNSIELYVPSHVTASLHAPSIFIDKGVHFEGTCNMSELGYREAAVDNVADKQQVISEQDSAQSES